MSIQRTRTRRFFRRHAFKAALEERETDQFVADLEALKSGPTSFDEPPVDEDAPTEQIQAIPTGFISDPRPWTEEDARELGRRVRAEVAAAYNIPATVDEPEHLPVPHRRHLPAVGAWFAEHMRPVPLPAIPDAAGMHVVPLAELAHVAAPQPAAGDPLPLQSAQAQRGAQLVLEAAATTEPAHPSDFAEWLRLELGETYAACEDAIVQHAADARADLAHLAADYFQDVDEQLDTLNALTLPGWTGLENDLYRTGVFA